MNDNDREFELGYLTASLRQAEAQMYHVKEWANENQEKFSTRVCDAAVQAAVEEFNTVYNELEKLK